MSQVQIIRIGFSGYSGYSGGGGGGGSGFSGFSGKSGYSGFSGKSGYSGFSAASGYSGFSAFSGFSGFSSKSGYSGFSGKSGFSGFSGLNGTASASGYSGYMGAAGGITQEWHFDTGTTDSNPGSGNLRFNNADPSLATFAYVNVFNLNGTDVSAWLDGNLFADANSQNVIQIAKSGDSGIFSEYEQSSDIIVASGYRKIPLAVSLANNGSFSSGDRIVLALAYLLSGTSGYSGYSGANPGASGYSGFSGTSGYSGFSAASPGASGYSGFSGGGTSGYSGYSGGGGTLTQNAQPNDYTFVLGDNGKQIFHDSVTAHTYTIPANASVAYPIGASIEIANNNGSGNITLSITSDTLRRGDGIAGTGSRTIIADSIAAIRKTKTTEWMIVGAFA